MQTPRKFLWTMTLCCALDFLMLLWILNPFGKRIDHPWWSLATQVEASNEKPSPLGEAPLRASLRP